MRKIIISFVFLFFILTNVNAQINLTIQSENERIVKIINIADFSNNSISNNKSIPLNYDNYLLNIYPENNQIVNNNGTFILNNLKSFSNDRYKFIWIGIIFSLIFLSYLVIRNIG